MPGSPIPSSRVKTGICGPHHDVRRHVSGEKCKARVLAKAQQIVMNFWVLDDAKLLNILLDDTGLGAHERIDKFGCANGYTHAFQARYSDDIKLGFCKILFIEFKETLERVVMVDVLEHKFASSLSGDTGDVDFDFGQKNSVSLPLQAVGASQPAP
jgi:hypothetical protein